VKRAPSTLLSARKGAAAPRLVSAKKAAAASCLLRAVKRAAPVAPVVVLAMAGLTGCNMFTAIGNYDAEHSAPDTACCGAGETFYQCDIVLQSPMGVDDTPLLVPMCATDIDSARAQAVSAAQAEEPMLVARSANCEIPGCPVDGGAP
jgi:hypothetical protein